MNFIKAALLALLVTLVVFAIPTTSSATTREVGPGQTYATITAAMNAATNGDVVNVHTSTYYEQIEVTKDVTVQANGSDLVTVGGQCARAHGFHVTANGATLTGIKVNATVEASVLIEDGADDVTINAMTLQNFDCTYAGQDPGGYGQYRSGVASWNGGSGTVITNNIIKYRLSGTLTGSANGIWFKSTDSNPNGGGHVITGNTIVGGWDGIGGEEEGALHGAFDKNFQINSNVISDCNDDGIQVEGGGQNGLVKDNTITRCSIGIAFATPNTGPLTIQHNTITDLRTGLYDARYCFKAGYNAPGVVVYLFTNICVPGAGTDQWEGDCFHQANEADPSQVATFVLRLNYLNCYRYVGIHWSTTASWDYDTVCSSRPVGDPWFLWNDSYYNSLATFQAGTGQETHGQTC